MGTFDRLATHKPTVAGLGDAASNLLFSPSDSAQATFGQLKAGWAELRDWGAVPAVWPGETQDVYHDDAGKALEHQFQSWISFRKAWEVDGNADTTALQAQSIDLEAAKNYAAEFGFPGAYHARAETEARPGTDTKVHAPSVENQTAALETADAIDRASKAAQQAVNDFSAEVDKKAAKTIWDAVPKTVWIGAAAIVAVVVGAELLPTILAARAARRV